MTIVKPMTGTSAAQDPRRIACETSNPAMPTYIGFLLIELAPVLTSAEACAGSNGSKVVPLRRNIPADAPPSANEATAVAPATAVRAAVGGRTSLVSAR